MAAQGYLDQQDGARPFSFGAVLLLHGAAIAALLLIKGPEWQRAPEVDTNVYQIPVDKDPPPLPPPPTPDQPILELPPLSRVDVPPTIVPLPAPPDSVRSDPAPVPSGPVIGNDPQPQPPVGTGLQPQPIPRPIPPEPPLPKAAPVRVEARIIGGDLQPPYPVSEERAQREGSVRLRLTIGANGRVTAVERLSATSDAFWRATERQALSRWRFRPATLDGRPVESTMVMTVQFRLDDR